MIKRLVSLSLIVVTILVMALSLGVSANSSDLLEFKVTASEIANGRVTATVSIEENPGIISYVVALKYDKTKFKAVYNSANNSAVVDKKLFGNYMDAIVSNSNDIDATEIADLDYITAVAVTSLYNINFYTTGDLFSIDFEVLDSSVTVFPAEIVVLEAFTYNPEDTNANADGQVALDYKVTNSNGVYKVNHYKEKSNGGYETVTEILTAPVGSTVTAQTKNYDSHTFDEDAQNVLTGKVDVSGSLALERFYKINNYTITFNYQDATSVSVASTTSKHGEYVVLPDENTFSKTGYNFKGWYTLPGGNGVKYTSKTVANESIELYAYWMPRPFYEVKHYLENLDGGYTEVTEDTEKIYADVNQSVSALPNNYTGYSFDISSSKTSDVVAEDNSTVLEFYYNRETFEVKFYDDINGTQIGDTQYIKYLGSATAPTAPTKESTAQYHFTFVDWDKEFTNVAQNLDVYPKFNESLRSYTITYDYQGATTAGVLSNTIAYGSNIILPEETTFERTGYNFKGWFSLPNGEGFQITTSNVVTGEMILYAGWNVSGEIDSPSELSTIKVGNAITRKGKEIVIPITISDNIGLTGLHLNCSFDDILTLTNVETGTTLSGLEFTTSGDLTSNSVYFLWDGMDADDSNGEILYLTFRVSNNAEVGDYNISLTVNTAYDKNLEDVNIKTKSGTISVIEYIPGDVNDDDEVNVKDIILIRRYIAGGYGEEIIEAAADVDENDEINAKDIILLRRFIAGGYGVELN